MFLNKKNIILFNFKDTIIGIIDKCKTQIGSRLLKRWIKQPL